MPTWFAKYGFPIHVVYVMKLEGGAMIQASATVELINAEERLDKEIEEAMTACTTEERQK